MASHELNIDSAGNIPLPPSRLIPGSQAPGPTRRAKNQSVIRDARYWQRAAHKRGQPGRGFLEGVPKAVLPWPWVPGQSDGLGVGLTGDLLVVVMGCAAADRLKQLAESALRDDFSSFLRPLPFSPSALTFFLLYGTLFTLLAYSQRLYQPETQQAPAEERFILAKGLLWTGLIVAATVKGCGLSELSSASLAISLPFNFLLLLGGKSLQRRVSRRPRPDDRHVLIIGAGDAGRRVAEYLASGTAKRRAVLGFLDPYEPVGGEIRGRVEDLAYLARTEFVDEIIVTSALPQGLAQSVIREARLNRIDIKVVPDLFGFDPACVLVEKYGSVPVLALGEEHIPELGLLLKRGVDIVLSLVGLVVTAPLLAATAIAIKLDSPGPVLYRAPRVGLKGRRFQCHKFRTMVRHADGMKEQLRGSNERRGATFKMARDPRITRVGRVLRRYSLDELPQLWDVLKGEMSMVGPRPHPVDDFERYSLEDLQRLAAIPGLTGLWQVTARGDPSFERNVALDREYIENWSLWKDFRILYKTLLVVLQGNGA